jgi:hypothetical protein
MQKIHVSYCCSSFILDHSKHVARAKWRWPQPAVLSTYADL